MSAEHVGAMGAVLAEHYPEMNYDGEIDGCGCDRQIGAFVGMTDREDYALHLATVLVQSPAMRDLLAEAWDEGEDAGYGGAVTGMGSGANPYRTEGDR